MRIDYCIYRRELFPDGILYTSQDSHYSVLKATRMYRMRCVMVDTLVSGEIDYAHLKALLLANKDKPALINLNIGIFLILGMVCIYRWMKLVKE